MARKPSSIGLYRQHVLKDFNPKDGVIDQFIFGANQITGWRTSQEIDHFMKVSGKSFNGSFDDAWDTDVPVPENSIQPDRLICIPDFYKGISYFAVFDGHGGEFVSEYLSQHFHYHLINALKDTDCDIELALYLAFLNADFALYHISEEEFHSVNDTIKKEFSIKDLESKTSDKSKPDTNEDFKASVMSEVRNFMLNIQMSEKINLRNKVVGNSSVSTSSSHEGENTVSGEKDDVLKPVNEDDVLKPVNEDDDKKEESVKAPDSSDLGPEKDSISADVINDSEKLLGSFSKSQEGEFPCIGKACGSTATVLLSYKDKVYVAYVGDSRCVASTNGQAEPITFDHKPNEDQECRRIKQAGLKVTKDGRINGGLNMSRAFGDFGLKTVNEPASAVTCEPHIIVLDANRFDYIVIASDGIWNAMSNEDVISFISGRDEELSEICAELINNIINTEESLSGHDNLTLIIFKNHLKLHANAAEDFNYLQTDLLLENMDNMNHYPTTDNVNLLLENINSSVPENIHPNIAVLNHLNNILVQPMGYIAHMKAILPRIQHFIENYEHLLQTVNRGLYHGYIEACAREMQEVHKYVYTGSNVNTVNNPSNVNTENNPSETPGPSTSAGHSKRKRKVEVIDISCSDDDSDIVEPIAVTKYPNAMKLITKNLAESSNGEDKAENKNSEEQINESIMKNLEESSNGEDKAEKKKFKKSEEQIEESMKNLEESSNGEDKAEKKKLKKSEEQLEESDDLHDKDELN